MAIKMDGDKNESIMADINMTPLIDIMLVLLIIFMVTSSISLESGVDIDIPETKGKTAKQEGNSVVISLNQTGAVFVQGKEVPTEQLKDSIAEALQSSSTKMVIFEGDKASSLGRTIEIMDVAKEAGAEKFAIAAEENSN